MSNRKEWAESFQRNKDCLACPFVKNAADIGVGTIYDCDGECTMTVEKILERMTEHESCI